MKVILLSDVARVGKKYAIVEVAPGYARNFLLARSLAEAVTRTNGKRIAELTKKREVEKKKQDDNLDKSLSKLSGVVLTIARNANEEGHLYAGVTKEELALLLGKQVNVAYTEDNIELEKPIKDLGDFTIVVVAGAKKADFALKIERLVEAE